VVINEDSPTWVIPIAGNRMATIANGPILLQADICNTARNNIVEF
jgi:hypothetical protein